MRTLHALLLHALLLGLLAPSAASAQAQEFPARPIELVIPFGAGGSHDLTARALSSVAQQYLGQPLLVVLKPGGGGAVASQLVSRARPDGYTLLFGGSGPNTIYPIVQKAPTGPEQLAAVARINYSPAVFAVRADAPWRTFREALDHMKKNPGALRFANTGTWGAADLPMRILARAAGIEYSNIPYDGGGPALLAVLGGHADASFLFTAQLLPQIGAGKIRALAVTDTARHQDLPDVPTLREEGIDVVFTQWRAVLAPRGTPQPILEKLESAFKRMSEDRSFQALVRQLGDGVYFQTAREFEATWAREWSEVSQIASGAQK